MLQGSLLLLLISESIYDWFRQSIASPLVIVLICVEGLAGGAAYVSVFYQIGTEEGGNASSEPAEEGTEDVIRAQEHEFKIGCVGVSGKTWCFRRSPPY
jgi:battenin